MKVMPSVVKRRKYPVTWGQWVNVKGATLFSFIIKVRGNNLVLISSVVARLIKSPPPRFISDVNLIRV